MTPEERIDQLHRFHERWVTALCELLTESSAAHGRTCSIMEAHTVKAAADQRLLRRLAKDVADYLAVHSSTESASADRVKLLQTLAEVDLPALPASAVDSADSTVEGIRVPPDDECAGHGDVPTTAREFIDKWLTLSEPYMNTPDRAEFTRDLLAVLRRKE